MFLIALALIGYFALKVVRPYYLTHAILGSDEYQTKVDRFESIEVDKAAAVLIGNSITERIPDGVIEAPIANLGISGDMLDGLENRVSFLSRSKPELIIIALGINDIINGKGYNQSSVIGFLENNDDWAKSADFAFLSITPCDFPDGTFARCDRANREIQMANLWLREFCEREGHEFLDCHDDLQVEGRMNPLYSEDGVHLNKEGYELWAKPINELISKRSGDSAL